MHPADDADLAAAGGWSLLIRRFDRPEVRALVLMGSHARGDPGPFSDVDLVRLLAAATPPLPDSGSHLLDGRLVVVSDVTPDEVETWFVRPELAVSRIAGLRQGKPLLDREGTFAALQARARAFVWDAAMQARADAYAGDMLVGLIEEVHKGLAGLRSGDVGRLLNAEFGLSWLLNRLMHVQRGVLLTGDNSFFDQGEAAIGADTEWARLRRRAFGVPDGHPPPTLAERVIAGLRLYAVTADLLRDHLTPEAAALVAPTMRLVREELTRPLS